MLVTWLLVIGTTESARVNAVLVAIKVAALTLFVALTIPVMQGRQFRARSRRPAATGVLGAAASIFFAYVGFDAVSTAAEETKNPQRNVPIGLIGSLLICTLFYLLVAARRDRRDRRAAGDRARRRGRWRRDRPRWPAAAPRSSPAARSSRWSARRRRWRMCCARSARRRIGNLVGLAAVLALPSVVLMMMFGQTRVFFTMARDGLLPEQARQRSTRRYRTPHVVTVVTGVGATLAAAFLPVGKLADYSNSGTLFAFFMVAISVMVLRRTDPGRQRPFRTPAVWRHRAAGDHRLRRPLFLAAADSRSWCCRSGARSGCWSISATATSAAMSAAGSTTCRELDPDAPPVPVPPLPGAPTPGGKQA